MSTTIELCVLLARLDNRAKTGLPLSHQGCSLEKAGIGQGTEWARVDNPLT